MPTHIHIRIINKIRSAYEITRQFGMRRLLYEIRRYVLNRAILQRAYLTEDRLIRRDELNTLSGFATPFGETETVEFSLSDCVDDYPRSVTQLVRLGPIQIEQPTVYEVPNVTLLGGNAVALSEDGAFILEEMLRNEELLGASLADIVFDNPKYALSHIVRMKTTNNIDHAASLINLGGYYHWFMSFLPQVQAIQAYEKAKGLSPTIMIRPDPPEWMRTSLKLIGYWDRVTEWDGRTTRINQLIVPTIPREETLSGDRVYSPFLVKNMRNRILASVDLNSQTGFSRHVYISREDTNTRRVTNKKELFSALPGSFESYCLSELSLIDQIRLFSTAETVVAPHGAGLVNILWGSDIDVVELYGVVGNSSFFQLAQNLGHNYTCVHCESDGRDLIVDPDALRHHIDCLLSN